MSSTIRERSGSSNRPRILRKKQHVYDQPNDLRILPEHDALRTYGIVAR